MKQLTKTLLLIVLATSPSFCRTNTPQSFTLKTGSFCLVVSENEAAPVKLAAETLQRDFERVMGYRPPIVRSSDPKENGMLELVVFNESSAGKTAPRPLDGFESHRIYVEAPSERIYITGKDMRGTIYAIYSFSERFLDVPPLWYFASWEPRSKKRIDIPADYDHLWKSPQVRYRAWFPNDTDMFTPWRKLSRENDELWHETMLRLKLNTVELEGTVTYPDYRLDERTALLRQYGLILSSTHHTACNNDLSNWEGYWREVRGMAPPPLSLSNKEALCEFWRYGIETVCRSGQENLWTLAFRGTGDEPFWAAFMDAPEGEKARAEVINQMLRLQLGLIRETTGDKHPMVRITFYDELSDLLAKGYLKPPTGDNVLWTFVAARRDHYPYEDLVSFDPEENVNLGYYMNFQFTSTGAHLAPAEGPWKMEFNFRYVNDRGPLRFSVVNAGNLREFVMELSANARMMWDMESYDTDAFLLEFCTQYFGKRHAAEAARLYRAYYDAYWQPKRPEFQGLERQYLFQDLRYSRAIRQLCDCFFDPYTPNPLIDLKSERIPGRTFRIEGVHQIDSLLAGTSRAALRFADAAQHCDDLLKRLPKGKRRFFRDNLAAPCRYMEALNLSLYHLTLAYKGVGNRGEHLDKAISELERARDALYATQEGNFAHWYTGDTEHGKFNIPARLRQLRQVRAKL